MDYGNDVIGKGAVASRTLAYLPAQTISNNSPINVAKRIITSGRKTGYSQYLFEPISGYDLVATPVSGNVRITDPETQAYHFIADAANVLEQQGFEPVAITDVLDMSNIDTEQVIPAAKRGLLQAARDRKMWLANGETAGLGDRVTVPYNISGLAIGVVKKGHGLESKFIRRGREFAVINHEQGNHYYLNADGVGTKINWHEMLYSEGLPFAEKMLQDGTAMLWDDAVKFNARILLDARVLEVKDNFHDTSLHVQVAEAMKEQQAITNVISLLKATEMKSRINGYGLNPMNLSGTTLSVITDEQIAKGGPKPKQGQYLVGLSNPNFPSFRSNGITLIRNIVDEEYGNGWHIKHPELLQHLTNPSTVFYKFFRYLFNTGLTSYVGHFSGGSYDEKLAKPLGKFGLGGEFNLNGGGFELQEELVKLQMEKKGRTLQQICAQQPYRLEGWATTYDPETVIKWAGLVGLSAVNLGRLEKMNSPNITVNFQDLKQSVNYLGYNPNSL